MRLLVERSDLIAVTGGAARSGSRFDRLLVQRPNLERSSSRAGRGSCCGGYAVLGRLNHERGCVPIVEADHPSSLRDFADIARLLEAESTPEKIQERVTATAVGVVSGCDFASISIIRQNRRIETIAATGEVPERVDAIQYAVRQGPCLSAIAEHHSCLISDLAIDERWPAFSHRAAREEGVRSMLSLRLFVRAETTGALNLFSRRVDAFGVDARAVGTLLAAQAALAVKAGTVEHRAEQLDIALQTNRMIGVGIGLLMANLKITEDEAFTLLRGVSQHLNIKLRDVAAGVVESGHLPP